MSIRRTLLLFVSVLALFIAGFAFKGVYTAWNNKQVFEFSKKSSETINLLLTAAGNWAVERGVTNSGLSSASFASDEMLQIITKRRTDGDAAYHEAMRQLKEYKFDGKETLVAQVREAYEKVEALRIQASENLKLSQIQRDSSLLKLWVPTMSKLIVLSQDLRFALTQKTASTDSELGRQSQLKHFSWIMSEFAGRERAIMGGTISADLGLDEKKFSTLSRFRGNVETGWDIVQKLATSSNDEVRQSVEETRELFFGKFQIIRESVYDASINGDDMPLTTEEWIRESTSAINSILATQEASTHETKAYVKKLLIEANLALMVNAIILLVSLLVVLGTFYTIIARVSRPIDEMTHAMNQLADGDTSIEIPTTGRKDEMGMMASSVQIFKENAIERENLQEQQKELEIRAEADKKAAMQKLADSFERRIQSVINNVSTAATQLSQTASHMNGLIDESSNKAQGAANGATETSSNVQSVAASVEEMSSTVKEISDQIHQSNQMVSHSVDNVENADKHAQNLTASSNKVQEVVQLIADISGQINLLALNATIESARAGEAGKGFAVVASEVKNLAGQTDKSIQEIEAVIGEMHHVSTDIVQSLNAIKSSVEDISKASGGIASAVEEQSATTNEIAHNMQSAAQGTQKIIQSLEQVSESASQSQSAAAQVKSAAKSLSDEATKLDNEVRSFVSEIRDS
jgi:methyl-accepting chemotaxis protein